MDITKLLIKANDKLLDAIKAIDSSNEKGTKLALVVDDQNKLIGVVSDGDIRRGLLKTPSLDQRVSEIMTTKFIYATKNESRSSLLNKMKACMINQVPVINELGNVVGLHLLSDFIIAKELPNVAVIMAGGKGTRLYPITNSMPKPMIKVAGTPILEHIVNHLVSCGIKRIFISVNYMSEIIEGYFKDGSQFGSKIDYLRESKPLGTAGALSLLTGIHEDFLLMNGDLITQFDVGKLFDIHKIDNNFITVGAHDHVTKIPFGVLTVNKNNVIGIQEKPALHNLINGGVYIMRPEVLSMVSKDREVLVTDVIEQCILEDKAVGFHLLENEWIDVGEHEQLANARGN